MLEGNSASSAEFLWTALITKNYVSSSHIKASADLVVLEMEQR